MPGATEDALLERLFSYYGPQEGDKKGTCFPGGLLCFLSRGPTYMGLDGTAWKGSLSPWAFLGPLP